MRIFLPLILCLLLFHCKTNKFTPANLPNTYLKVGNGGGFSGAEKSYTVLQNGQVFASNTLLDTTFALDKIKSSIAQSLFDRFHTDGLDTISLNNPGNLYRYIIFSSNGQTKKIYWKSFDETTDAFDPMNNFYETVMSTLKPIIEDK